MRPISFFISHPIQYFSPLFKVMSERIPVKVYYFSNCSIKGSFDKGFGKEVKWDIPLLEGYSFEFLRNIAADKPLNNGFFDVCNPGIFKAMRNENAGVVVVHGWTYSSTFLAIIAARIWRKKVWLRAENPLNQEVRRSGLKAYLKKIFLRHLLFPQVNRCLYIGKESKKFFEYYGVRGKKLLYAPYAVDNNFFRREYEKYRQFGPELKDELGIPQDRVVFLYSGKYIKKKNPMSLLRAFAMMKHRDDSFLIMMGEGELRDEMQKFIENRKIQSQVLLTGFINQSVVSKFYSVCDVFVMCSGMGETWGLSVNEVMNFAKPVIVSDSCGCRADLVKHGVNGFVFKESDLESLTRYMDNLSADSELRCRTGEASAGIIKNYSYEVMINNIIKELESIK